MRVTILGASGFIGRHLANALRRHRDEVITGSLRDVEVAANLCNGSDAVVNLAGAPIAGRRWSTAYKEEISSSRVAKTRDLIERLRSVPNKPRIYIGASAIGYYGPHEDERLVESSAPGSDFLAQLCVAWEKEAMRARELEMRVAVVRTGLVLGDGGALEKMIPPFLCGLGGIVGSGTQWWSWIHIDDIVGVYQLAIASGEAPINGVAPNPVRNRDFTTALGRALHRPTPLPVPAFALTLALGEGASVLTSGQRVLPERAEVLGYRFKFPELDGALEAIIGS